MGFSDLFISVDDLPDDSYGFFQLLCLGSVYGYVLMTSSNLISDGSELLLLVPSVAGIVGSIVLPVLGAVPDGCIVLFSGLGPDAQEQLNVGIGALAGSTIMLLTIPWFLSILGGRVNVVDGAAVYKHPKLSPPGRLSLSDTGITLGSSARSGAVFMLLTSTVYLFIQIPGMMLLGDSSSTEAADERPWAITGFFLALFFLAAYLYYQYRDSLAPSESSTLVVSRDEYLKEAIATGKITLLGLMIEEFARDKDSAAVTSAGERTPLKTAPSRDALERLRVLLRPFFKKYDRDNSGTLDIEELGTVFKDLGEDVSSKHLKDIFREMDRDRSGHIDYSEFVQGTAEYVLSRGITTKAASTEEDPLPGAGAVDDSGEGEDEEEVPEDLADLSPEEQQRAIKIRAAWMMALGTALVLIFSDPMVDVLSAIGTRTNIPSFYVAFVLAPFASNASELIAAYNYAQKKTTASIAVSIASLQGAAVMNNCFVLGVFLLLIVSQALVWEYFAETLTILLVQIVVAIYSFKTTHTVLDGCFILSLYPLSLALVAGLEALGYD